MSTTKHVYFFKPVGMEGPIKIGTAASPLKRISRIAAWSPFPLELMGAVPGDFTHESFLHQRFADLHSHKEWFHSSPLLLRTIERILSGETFEAACAGLPVIGSIKNAKPRKRPERHKRERKYIGPPLEGAAP